MKRAWFLIVLTVALVATSCGLLGEEDVEVATDPLANAITNDVVFRENPLTTSPDAAACLGNRMLIMIGGPRLNELGVTMATPDFSNTEFSAEEQELVDETIDTCLALDEKLQNAPIVLTQEQVADRTSLSAALIKGGVTDDLDAAECVSERLFDRFGPERAQVLVEGVTKEDFTKVEGRLIFDDIARCVVTEDFGDVEFTTTEWPNSSWMRSGFIPDADCNVMPNGGYNLAKLIWSAATFSEDSDLGGWC